VTRGVLAEQHGGRGDRCRVVAGEVEHGGPVLTAPLDDRGAERHRVTQARDDGTAAEPGPLGRRELGDRPELLRHVHLGQRAERVGGQLRDAGAHRVRQRRPVHSGVATGVAGDAVLLGRLDRIDRQDRRSHPYRLVAWSRGHLPAFVGGHR
jgi:hypothetical protein